MHLDKILAGTGIVVSAALVAYIALTTGRLIFILAGVLTLTCCLLWLAVRERAIREFPVSWAGGAETGYDRSGTVLLILFFALYMLSIVALHTRASLYERPTGYFVLSSLMAGVIALEILLPHRRKARRVLPQIVLLGVSVVWSQILIVPGILGSDPWWHRMFVSQILDLSAIPGGYWYTHMPLFHLEVAGASLLAGLDYRLAAMLSVSLAQIIILPVVVYLLGNALFEDERVGLLAGLLLITANQQIGMSTASIPNAFAAIFIALVLFLLFRLKYTRPVRAGYLAYLLLAAIILTHTIAAACMALILFVVWGACRVHGRIRDDAAAKPYPVTLGLASLFLAAMLGWWYFVSGHIAVLADLIRQGFTRAYFVQNPAVVDAYPGLVPVPEQVFNNIGMFAFFTVSLVGIFYLAARRERNGFAFGMVGIILLGIGFFPLITGLSFIEHRWWYFSQILLAVPLAASFLLVAGREKAHRMPAALTLAACVGLLAFTMIASPAADTGIPLFSPNSAVRAGFTGSELQAIDTVGGIRAGAIGADRYVQVVNYVNPGPGFVVPADDMLIEGAYRSHGMDAVLVREYIRGHPIFCYDGMFRLTHDPAMTLAREGYYRVYESGSVGLFRLDGL
ncbi:MAG TPA: hypothetical protein PKJ67_05815 [Methanoculleus sp.]|nr:hypothetical protein [Methanoculleus sp.]